MVYDDARELVEKYTAIVGYLACIDGTKMPTTAVSWGKSVFDLYNGDKPRDPWKALVDIELHYGVKLGIEDLAVFNILNVGFWNNNLGMANEVFSIDTSSIESCISYKMFLACCMALSKSYQRESLWTSHPYVSVTRRYAIDKIAFIDKLKPLFLAKLFTEDIKRFMACIELSKSIELPTFIVRSFMKKTPLNKTMFRTVVSLFKQEMAHQRMKSMFMN